MIKVIVAPTPFDHEEGVQINPVRIVGFPRQS
jgi:hypothetical protein